MEASHFLGTPEVLIVVLAVFNLIRAKDLHSTRELCLTAFNLIAAYTGTLSDIQLCSKLKREQERLPLHQNLVEVCTLLTN